MTIYVQNPRLDPVLGDRSRLDEMRDNEARGSIFALRKRYVERHFGAAELSRLAASLDGKARGFLLEPPLASGWFPFGTLIDIDRALIAGPFAGDVSRMQPLTEWGAREDVPVLFKFFLRLGTPGFVMKRLGVAFSSKMRKGTLREERSDGSSATIVLEGVLMPLYYCLYGMPAWAAAALTLTGARDVITRHVECQHQGASLCRWLTRWR